MLVIGQCNKTVKKPHACAVYEHVRGQNVCRPILSVIILVSNKSDSATRSSDFVNCSYDYRTNGTPLGSITIINSRYCFVLFMLIVRIWLYKSLFYLKVYFESVAIEMCHHHHYRYHHLKREFYFHFKQK